MWVVDAGGKAGQRPVTVGEWHGDEWFIYEGLQAGDRVAVDGTQTLQPGMAVSPQPLGQPAAPGAGPAAGGQ